MSEKPAKTAQVALPPGVWLGELTGSGNGLCHAFPRTPGSDPTRLPHTALCGASTGRGAERVEAPRRPMCIVCGVRLAALMFGTRGPTQLARNVSAGDPFR